MKKQAKGIGIHTIRGSLLLALILLLASVSVTFFIYALRYTDRNVQHNAIDYTVQLIDQVNNDIDSYITYMENISEIVSRNPDVREYLFSQSLSGQEDEALYEKIRDHFRTMLNVREDIYNVAVMAENGRSIIGDGSKKYNPYSDIQNSEWYKQAMDSDGESVLSSSHVQNILTGSYTWVVTLSRRMKNPYNGKLEALLFVDLNYAAISDLCERISLGDRGYIFVLDQQGELLYHPRQQLIYSGIKTEHVQEVMDWTGDYFQVKDEDGKKLYTISRSDETGWTTVGVTYMDELIGNRREIERTYGIVVILVMTFAVFIISLISRRITRPLLVLKNAMQSVDNQQLMKVNLNEMPENEIGSLSQSFNAMTDQIQQLMKENEEEQRQKRASEQRALQAQINPHFLYNTLDSIIWMAESGKNEDVVIMTASLARMMRATLNSQNELVTIEQEMLHVKSYLTIQQMRYRDKLEFEIRIDPDIRSAYIVKLVVQPLVENAIYHGIKYKENKGKVVITGERKGKNVLLTVKDSGQGMDEETLKNIFKKHKVNYTNNGVGVYNVQARLQLHYGEEYGLRYESSPGQGTCAYILIPYIEEVQEHETS